MYLLFITRREIPLFSMALKLILLVQCKTPREGMLCLASNLFVNMAL